MRESVVKIRAEVSPALSKAGLAKVGTLLNSFKERYPRSFGDIIRFEFLLDEMFDVFISSNIEIDSQGNKFDCFPPTDNFDTGNASESPYYPFVEAIQKAYTDIDGYRGYYGPKPVPGLQESIKSWLEFNNFISSERASSISVSVGHGTVQLYDVLCRSLIRAPGDLIIIPEITYGFFIPQIERNKGRFRLFNHAKNGKPNIPALGVFIDELNRHLLNDWKKNLFERLKILISEIESNFQNEIKSINRSAILKLYKTLNNCNSSQTVYDELEEFILTGLCRMNRSVFDKIQNYPLIASHFPPRVVGYLHINPNIYGNVYEEKEIRQLTRLLDKKSVTIIEDIAYHSLGSSLSNINSCLNYGENVFCLIGLSKPLSIANCRLGIMLGEKSSMEKIYRSIENSIGFVSTFLQKALLETFFNPQKLNDYFEKNYSGDLSYRFKKNLFITCFEGIKSKNIDANLKERCRQLIIKEVNNFFKWKRKQGIQLIDPKIRFPDGTAENSKDFQKKITSVFLNEGLKAWFRIIHQPECGFFVVVDCSKLLKKWDKQELSLDCSFDVFALLAVIFGIRTIPEECMGNLEFKDSHRLRFSYSISVETIIRGCLTLHIGLKQLSGQK